MRIPFTHYTFRPPEEMTEGLFLVARHHPSQIRAQYRRATLSRIVLTTFRVVVVVVLFVWGPYVLDRLQEGGWTILGALVTLGGFALGLSYALSTFSYMSYVFDMVLYWEDLLSAAKRQPDLDGFRRKMGPPTRLRLGVAATTKPAL